MHFCQDEVLAISATLSSLPIVGVSYYRAKAWIKRRCGIGEPCTTSCTHPPEDEKAEDAA